MTLKNKDVLNRIEEMLDDLKASDKQQFKIVIQLLDEVFKEFNSKRPRNVDKKLYDLIDAEVTYLTREAQDGN